MDDFVTPARTGRAFAPEHRGPAAGTRPVGGPRVLVVADAVVAEAVRVALDGHGLTATSASWRDVVRRGVVCVQAAAHRAADVGLLITDLDTETRVQDAQQVLAQVPLPWLTLTGAPRGPLWGAVLSDSRSVMASSTHLRDLVQVLRDIDGGASAPGSAERDALVREWEVLWDHRVQLASRLTSLSPREREVLRLLYRGEAVARISATLGVAESTVRSQVKSMLRKMGVRSQLEAVATYGVLRSSPGTVCAAPGASRPVTPALP